MNLTWRELVKKLPALTEAELTGLLMEERTQRRRAHILLRLHQRFSVVRCARERLELLKEALAP